MLRGVVSFLIVVGLTALPISVFAQQTAESVSTFFNETPPSNNNSFETASDREREIIAMREALDDILDFGDNQSLRRLLTENPDHLEQHHPALHELAMIFDASVTDGQSDRQELIDALAVFESPDDWYAAMYADTALSALHVRRLELLLGAQYAQSALDRIPEEVSVLVTDAQLLIAAQMTMLYGVGANTDQMLEISETSRRLHAELGLDFNRYESMTNFLLAFNRKRDHEGAVVIAELLQSEPRPDSVAEGLAEVYTADLYNEIGDHARALEFALMASTASDPLIKRRSSGEAMIAYAGLGRRAEAIREMRTLGLWDDNGPTEQSRTSEAGLHARALLAASSGNSARAVALMNQRLDLMIGRMYDRGATDTAAFLTHLENSRERQQERETALQREAELQAVQLEQQNRLNRLLWVLIGGLAIAFNLLLAFLRYREKNNRKVHALQDDALSAEKMKTEFLGNINHELRTPLNGIIGISDAMIHYADDPKLKAQAAAVQESGQLLHDLVDSLITMSTIEGNRLSLDTEEVSLPRLFAREIAEWEEPAARKGLTFTHHIDDSLTETVLADGPRLRKCLRFLLSNAVRFTHAGRIHLHATGVSVDGTATGLTLIVADTGQGISEDVKSRLFKPFLQADTKMTRKYGGSGLSLAIARKIARMMGGDLTVNSREGRGSEFTLTATLPLAQKAIRPVLELTEIVEDGAETQLVLPASRKAAPPATLDLAETPEEVVDLMLSEQLFKTSGAAPARTILRYLGEAGTAQARTIAAIDGEDYRVARFNRKSGLLRDLRSKPAGPVILDLGQAESDPVDLVRRLRDLERPGQRMPIIGLVEVESASLGSDLVTAGLDIFLPLPLTEASLRTALQQAADERSAA